jgi:uncharacterized protein
MEHSNVAPASLQQRLEVVDIIRGVALLAIVFVNMAVFSLDFEYLASIGLALLGTPDVFAPLTFWDKAAMWMVNVFISGRFLPILAMLFGWGCYMIMERVEQKGRSSMSLLWRRLGLLLGFGVLHYVFIWSGDILMLFAVNGAFLLLFMRMSIASLRKWIIGWTIALILVLGLVGGILFSLIAAVEPAEIASFISGMDKFMTPFLDVFREGSYWEVVGSRAPGVLFMPFGLLFSVPFTLIIFLVGLYAAKAKVVDRLIHNKSMLRRALILALVSAVLGLGISTLLIRVSDNWPVLAFAGILGMVGWIGNVLFYIFVLIRLGNSDRFRGLLRSFIPVGQMPLTVYLMQSVIATSVLYGYGLGLADQVGPAEGILLSVGIFACCMIFSRVWFRFFALGPMEWLWRRLMYGREVRLHATPGGQ